MFAEDTIFDVVGCLEFDPSLSAPKRHREYLKSIATFHQVSHEASKLSFFEEFSGQQFLIIAYPSDGRFKNRKISKQKCSNSVFSADCD